MTVRQLTGTTAVVTGASRGFGRAIAVSLAGRGAHVVGVARDRGLLAELKEQSGESITDLVADDSYTGPAYLVGSKGLRPVE